jgi:hypothetical protein
MTLHRASRRNRHKCSCRCYVANVAECIQLALFVVTRDQRMQHRALRGGGVQRVSRPEDQADAPGAIAIIADLSRPRAAARRWDEAHRRADPHVGRTGSASPSRRRACGAIGWSWQSEPRGGVIAQDRFTVSGIHGCAAHYRRPATRLVPQIPTDCAPWCSRWPSAADHRDDHRPPRPTADHGPRRPRPTPTRRPGIARGSRRRTNRTSS